MFSQIFMRRVGGDDGGKDVHYFWFDLVNSGHMYRMWAHCAIICAAMSKEPHMSDFVLTCESAADRTREFFASRNIPVVCFHYEIDDVVYTDDLYQSISVDYAGRVFCPDCRGRHAQDVSGERG